MRTIRRPWIIPAAAFLLFSTCRGLAAQDQPQSAPTARRVLLQNDHVRVFDVTIKPGEKSAARPHPDHLLYLLADGKLKLLHADGTTTEFEGKAGKAVWVTADSHAAENIGAADFHALVVELTPAATSAPAEKPAAKTKPASAAHKALPPDDSATASPETTKLLFENEYLRVLENRVKPGGKISQHTHPWPHIAYGITTLQGRFVAPGGAAQLLTLPAGMAVWIGPVTHVIENVGQTESRTLNIEIKTGE